MRFSCPLFGGERGRRANGMVKGLGTHRWGRPYYREANGWKKALGAVAFTLGEGSGQESGAGCRFFPALKGAGDSTQTLGFQITGGNAFRLRN